ncbi:MAG: hypothetical protein JNK82_36920 [Myxococcaceae bacterium]|nr:hypothetical protein [Myxococcaceae bacterium]
MRIALTLLLVGCAAPPGPGGEAGGSTAGGAMAGGAEVAGGGELAGGDEAAGGGEAGGATAGGATAGGASAGGGQAGGGMVPDAGPLVIGDDVGPGRFKVLFDATKAQQAGNADWVIDDSYPSPQPASPMAETDWVGGYSAWGVALQRSGRFDLETLRLPNRITFLDPANPQDLRHFHAFVVPEPNIALTATEMTALVEYVRAGGGLFLIGNHGGSDRNGDGIDSVGVINALASARGNPFGITLAGDDFYQAPCRSVAEDPRLTILHGDFGDAGRTTFFNGSMLRIDPFANPTARPVFWRNNTLRGTTNVLMAKAQLGKGRVLISGDSSAPDDGTGRPGATLHDAWSDSRGDNAVLFPNATLWLADGRCSNGALDPDEADVDCGGRCEPCASGSACTTAADCGSGTCSGTVCSGFTVEQVAGPCDHPEVRVDAQGQAHVVYEGNAVVAYARRQPTGAWVQGTVAAVTGTVLATKLALGAQGEPHAVWDDLDLFHATPGAAANGPWSKDMVSTYAGYGTLLDVEVDAQQRPAVLTSSSPCQLALRSRQAGAWSSTEFDGGSGSCYDGALAFDRAGSPAVMWRVYESSAFTFTPRFAVLDGGPLDVDVPPLSGHTSGLVLDANGEPHMLIYAAGLSHLWRSGGTWSSEPIIGASPNADREVFGMDDAGTFYAAFSVYGADGGVFVSRRSSSGWSTERVAPSGSRPSLSFMGPGEPVVAFCGDRAPYSLYVAH